MQTVTRHLTTGRGARSVNTPPRDLRMGITCYSRKPSSDIPGYLEKIPDDPFRLEYEAADNERAPLTTLSQAISAGCIRTVHAEGEEYEWKMLGIDA
jgi:hypothetical protein